jgi:hypothetical protein
MKAITILFVLGLGCTMAVAPQVEASKPEERDRAVALTRFLEANPFDETAPGARERLTELMSLVPDLKVNLCGELIPEMYNKRTKMVFGHKEIFAQLGFGALAAVLRHPEISTDRYAQDLAGLESALNVYESVLLKDPTAVRPYLDDLIAMRKAGTLADEIKKRTDNCLNKH